MKVNPLTISKTEYNRKLKFDYFFSKSELLEWINSELFKTLNKYRAFSACCPTDDPKEFIVHQSGCRAALAHINLLIKLGESSFSDGFSDGFDENDQELENLIEEARVSLKRDGYISD
jgi:hypothetical protein